MKTSEITEERRDKTETHKQLLRHWAFEGFNQNNMAVADEVYDVNVSYYEPSAGHVVGLDALKQFVITWRTAFPDSRLTIEEEVAEGDRLAIRWTFMGTHQGSFRGLSPSGKPVKMSAMYFYRFARGKVVEIHAMVNSLGLLQQLGAVAPITGPVGA
jgi:steroid delta-isomerase-like uncharacterized protein